MQQDIIDRLQKVLEIVNFMTGEVCFNMQKIILREGSPNKYAIKKEVTNKLKVEISLHNNETKTTVCKSMCIYKFAEMCSDRLLLDKEFTKITYDLLEASEKKSSTIIYI